MCISQERLGYTRNRQTLKPQWLKTENLFSYSCHNSNWTVFLHFMIILPGMSNFEEHCGKERW